MRSNVTQRGAQAPLTAFQRFTARLSGAAPNLQGRVSRVLSAARRTLRAAEIGPLPASARAEEQSVAPVAKVAANTPGQLQHDERRLFRGLLNADDETGAHRILSGIRQTMGQDFSEHDDESLVVAFLDKVSTHVAAEDTIAAAGPIEFRDAWIATRKEETALAKKLGIPASSCETSLARVVVILRMLQNEAKKFVAHADRHFSGDRLFNESTAKRSDIDDSLMTVRIISGTYFNYCDARNKLNISTTDPQVAAAREYLAQEIGAYRELLRSSISPDQMKGVDDDFEPHTRILAATYVFRDTFATGLRGHEARRSLIEDR